MVGVLWTNPQDYRLPPVMPKGTVSLPARPGAAGRQAPRGQAGDAGCTFIPAKASTWAAPSVAMKASTCACTRSTSRRYLPPRLAPLLTITSNA
jgi:hypothetical protein